MREPMRTLILRPDWQSTLCWADAKGLVNENQLPLSDQIKERLDDYYSTWSELGLRNETEPLTEAEWRAFDEQGVALWLQLENELEGAYSIHFYSHEFNQVFATPRDYRKRT